MDRSAPPDEAPSHGEILRASPHHDAFLRLTERTRGVEFARGLLEAEWRYVGPLLEGCPAPRVLDLACGTGSQSLAWAERGARVVGLDVDPGLLRIARSFAAQAPPAGGPPPEWACADGGRLPFAAERFDAVFCNSLLEHVPAWSAVLAEIGRVLRPGGVAVIYTTNRHCPVQNEVNHFPFYPWLPEAIKRRLIAWIMVHRRDLVNYTDFPAINWFTYPGLRRAFEACGLEPFDRIDLSARGGLRGLKGLAARSLRPLPMLRWGYYLVATSTALYGVKRGRGLVAAPGSRPAGRAERTERAG